MTNIIAKEMKVTHFGTNGRPEHCDFVYGILM